MNAALRVCRSRSAFLVLALATPALPAWELSTGPNLSLRQVRAGEAESLRSLGLGLRLEFLEPMGDAAPVRPLLGIVGQGSVLFAECASDDLRAEMALAGPLVGLRWRPGLGTVDVLAAPEIGWARVTAAGAWGERDGHGPAYAVSAAGVWRFDLLERTTLGPRVALGQIWLPEGVTVRECSLGAEVAFSF